MLRLIRGSSQPRALPPYRKWVRLVFFALVPLALAGAIMLHVRDEHRDPYMLKVTTGRASAIAAARRFVATLGVNAGEWKAYCSAVPDPELFRYLRAQAQASDRARKLVPPVVVRVLLQSRDQDHRATVALSLNNDVLGYDVRNAGKPQASVPQSDEQSLVAATAMLSNEAELKDIFKDAKPEVATLDATGSGTTRKYTWRSPLHPLHELELVYSLSIRNGQVLSRSLQGKVDPDYSARHLRSGDTLLSLFALAYSLFAVIVAIYSITSYGRRATQKEVSHSRTLLLSLLIFVFFAGTILTSYDDTLLQTTDQEVTIPLAFIYTLMCLAIAGASLLVGVAYGSGEGAVREAYPGKLTSLDALVLGKLFSRNVGASVMVGVTFAGWFLLLTELLRAAFTGRSAVEGLSSVPFAYMNVPWVSFMLVLPAIGLLFTIGGLVQPLAFVTRFFTNLRLRMLVLIVLTTIAASGVAATKPALGSLLISMAVYVPGILIPFFAFDLLAALVCCVAIQFVGALVSLTVLYPNWTSFFAWMTGIVTATLIVQFWAWRRGRTWKEEEVRPEYARHIAERQSLEEEVAAAREAQLRLLPHSPPEIPGLSIHASCLPARVVGGDFYDFFELSNGRLGIFIAEGGNRGLASALTIALAKGYLMHTARGNYTPTQVVQRLEATLGGILEAGVARTTVAYAVVDMRNGLLSYARTGAYPKVVVAPSEGSAILSEREFDTPGVDRTIPIWEGETRLGEGDSIILYTDGIARRIASRSATLQQDWIVGLAQDQPDAHCLHSSLFEFVGAGTGKAVHELEDDLTAIVVRCLRIGTAYMEGVA